MNKLPTMQELNTHCKVWNLGVRFNTKPKNKNPLFKEYILKEPFSMFNNK